MNNPVFDPEIVQKEYEAITDPRVTLEQFQLNRIEAHDTELFEKVSKLKKEMQEISQIMNPLYQERKELDKKIKECEDKYKVISKKYDTYIPKYCYCGEYMDYGSNYCGRTGCY